MELSGRSEVGGVICLLLTSCTCILFFSPKLGLGEPSENVPPMLRGFCSVLDYCKKSFLVNGMYYCGRLSFGLLILHMLSWLVKSLILEVILEFWSSEIIPSSPAEDYKLDYFLGYIYLGFGAVFMIGSWSWKQFLLLWSILLKVGGYCRSYSYGLADRWKSTSSRDWTVIGGYPS